MGALSAAALLLSCGAFSSVANPLQTIFNPAGSLKGDATPGRLLYFSGFDLWREVHRPMAGCCGLRAD
jgi:hypothetical protein